MFNFLKVSSLKNPYLVSLPALGLTGVSGYSIAKNIDLVSDVENNYLARIQFDGSQNGSKKIHGESFNLSTDREKAISDTQSRLLAYYRKYGSKDVKVNVSKDTKDTKDTVDFFLHFKSSAKNENLNNLWLDNVRFNQLSIDRYGYGYEFESSSGIKKASAQAKVHKIVEWSNVDLDGLSYKSAESGVKPHIALNFFEESISKDEVEILINEDENKFKADDGTSNDWFIWLDKDLLALKLNYAFKAYVFGSPGAISYTSITSIIGNDSNRQGAQKNKYDAAKANYDSLSEEGKEFAKEYINQFLDTASTNTTSTDWSKVVSHATTKNHITPDDLNKIYIRFKSHSKSLRIFEPHLVSQITSGKNGNWRETLPLGEKEHKDTENQKSEENKKHYEAKEIEKIDKNASSEDKLKKSIKIFQDYSTSPTYTLDKLYEIVKNYSVRYFSLKPISSNTGSWISSTYSSLDTDKKDELLYVLTVSQNNEFGVGQRHILPSMLGFAFFSLVTSYITKAFRGPGGIFSAGVITGLTTVLGIFFALGSKLSLVGIAAVVVGLFYALMLAFYNLSFLKKLFSIEFLDKDNIKVAFKRGIIFASDLSLPLFIFSTLIAFLAPLHLREFGIVLSLCIFIFFLLIACAAPYIAIQYIRQNFLNMSNFYKSTSDKVDGYLNKFISKVQGSQLLYGGYAYIGLVFLSLILFGTIGFNSFSFLKNNYLITILDPSAAWSGSSSSAVDSSLIKNSIDFASIKEFGTKGGLTSFLIDGPFDFSKLNGQLNGKHFYIQETSAFSDALNLSDLFLSFSFAAILILIYVFIRFGFKNLLVFSLNNVLTFTSLAALFLVLRINVFSSIFIGICSFFAISIMYHMLFMNVQKSKYMDWFERISEGISNNVFWYMRSTCLAFFLISLFCSNEEIILMGLYVTIAFMAVHYIGTTLFHVLTEKLGNLKEKYMWKTLSRSSLSSEENNDEVENLDLYDEELIAGINQYY